MTFDNICFTYDLPLSIAVVSLPMCRIPLL